MASQKKKRKLKHSNGRPSILKNRDTKLKGALFFTPSNRQKNNTEVGPFSHLNENSDVEYGPLSHWNEESNVDCGPLSHWND